MQCFKYIRKKKLETLVSFVVFSLQNDNSEIITKISFASAPNLYALHEVLSKFEEFIKKKN